jgi:hypothetical protein
MKNLKTTLAGIGAIVTALGIAITQYTTGGIATIDFGALIVAVTAGVGLIAAKDSNVTGV